MRAFVALDITDDGVLDSLVLFQEELSATGADLKLVEKGNLHFTLKFLGNISESQAREADRMLGALRLAGGLVSVSGIGAFPNSIRPNVVWVGVPQDDEPKIRPIGEAVIKALAGIGERETRPFQAHVTLARVRSGRNREGLASLISTSSQRSFGSFKLRTFKLMSSQLTPSGPVYSDLGVYGLV